ncbi:MAG TPA: response regulator transcription factor [Polyangia bacterium]|nr:response regulator transcription factor [Polyangia bacterium]
MTAEKRPIRVLVCEDHAIVREGVVSLLEAHDDFQVIGEAGDGQAALELFRRQPPDVTLIDLRMPKLNGIEVIRVLRREFPGSRFLVLTTYDTEDDVTRALQAGASGYLLKGVNRTTLRDAIRLVHAGRRYIPPEIADRVIPGAAAEELTEREVEVLRRIAEGLSNKEIGEQLGISESTVKTHVNHLLEKLGVTDRTKALVLALKRGLVHID